MTSEELQLVSEKISHFKDFASLLRGLPYDRLPGLEAQLKLAPVNRKLEISSLGNGKNAVKSAVLFLFFPDENGCTTTVFIKRPEYNGAHSGQISFPGGRYETTDPSLEYTALRETHEEIGVPVSDIEVAGKLSDLFIPPSNYIVSPYIGITRKRPAFKADPLEVAAILEIELSDFFQTANCRTKELVLIGGYRLQTPCFEINGHTIWGATAMMVSEFLEFVGRQLR